MILSMTGFGRGTAVLNGREITVELRSVNSRYFEYSSRIPRSCSYMDSRLKKQLNERVTRGKVELSMTIQNVEAADAEVTVNMELARSYQKALRNLSEKLCIKNDITVSTLTRFPDVLATRHADVDEEQLWADVSAVTAQALDNFIAMRAAEGAKMKADVESRLCFLEERVGRVETLSAGRGEAYTNRLYEKLKTILEDRSIDDARVLTEAAIFGDKTAVDEETVRLRSHIAQYRSILELDEPVGRKLDFLTQELNRETNTIGSKCQDLDITRIVVDMKAEIEKIRGVKCDHAINKLVEYSLVRELGRLDAPGRPILLGTTEEFLRCFGVQYLESLPVPDPVQIEDFKAEAEEEIQLKLDV